MQKHISTQNPSLNRFIHRKSNKGTLTTVKRTRRAFSAAANDAQMSRISEIEGQSVFSRIGAVAQTVSFNQGKTTVNRIPSGKVIMRNQEQNNNQRKKKKPRRTRSKSNILNFKLPVIHEKRGTFSEEIKEKNKIQEGKNITPPNSATKKVEMSAPRKRKIVIDANDLDKELEEYMAAAPHAAASKVNDESEDLIDFEIDFMDIEE